MKHLQNKRRQLTILVFADYYATDTLLLTVTDYYGLCRSKSAELLLTQPSLESETTTPMVNKICRKFMRTCLLEMDNQAFHQERRSNPNRSEAHPPVLIGVKRQDLRGQSDTALSVGRRLAEREEIAYWVVSDDERSPSDKSANLRAHRRQRTRLRSAKLLDGSYRFLSEGRVCDRSRDGLRLMLARDVTLPPRLAVHIDETSEVREAKIIWRRGSTIGVELQETPPADAMTASQRSALRERYYAIPS
jgi:hypothetical protein